MQIFSLKNQYSEYNRKKLNIILNKNDKKTRIYW